MSHNRDHLAPSDPDDPIPLEPLSPDEAATLLPLRPGLGKLAATVDQLASKLATLCEHEHQPETCTVCWLYSKVTDLDEKLGTFQIDFDNALQRAAPT